MAFNGGSQGTISKPGDGAIVGKAILNTVICLSSAALTAAFFYRFIIFKTSNGWSFIAMANGSLVGMVAICAGCDTYRPWGAALLGIVSVLAFYGVTRLSAKLKRKKKTIQSQHNFWQGNPTNTFFAVDDPIQCIPVHFGGGVTGTICVFIFGENGILISPSSDSGYVNTIHTNHLRRLGKLYLLAFSFPAGTAHQHCRSHRLLPVVHGSFLVGVLDSALPERPP